jgi:hypothetical protein
MRIACQEPGEDFLRLQTAEKISRINLLYRQRSSTLSAHRKKYGESVSLCVLESRLEREYQRWSSILSYAQIRRDARRNMGPEAKTRGPQVDNGPVFKLFDAAGEHSPDDPRLLEAEAEFNRYVWNYARAAEIYDRLALIAPSGDTWRRARLSAAESRLSQYLHTRPPNPLEARRLLISANKQIEGLSVRDAYQNEAAVLRERIALEMGKQVDWTPIHAAFDAIVGDNYAGTVGKFLDRRRHGEAVDQPRLVSQIRITKRGKSKKDPAGSLSQLFSAYVGQSPAPAAGGDFPHSVSSPKSAETVADLLLVDFTSVDLLEGIGQLYLRSAELAATEDLELADGQAAGYAQRAYDCFDACRILQDIGHGETIVTKFLRGRSITTAAQWRWTANPFRWTLQSGRKSQLAEAESLLFAAQSASVGRFNRVCTHHLSSNRRLRLDLDPQPVS